MKEWYESKIKMFESKASNAMMFGDMKDFLRFQEEANNYKSMLRTRFPQAN